MSKAREAYEELTTTVRQIATLGSVSAVLHWDERTQMPTKGGAARAEQLALLSGLIHERFTAPRIGELLSICQDSDLTADPHSDTGANIRELRRQYDRATKLPTTLVQELTRAAALGHQAWEKAKKESNFAAFEPHLQRNIELTKQKAECYGYAGGEIYDALLEDYEPGARTADLREVFASLRGPLVKLIRRIVESPRQAPIEILLRKYPAAQQAEVSLEAARQIGYDLEAGRIDVSVHPFSIGIAPGDVRITTRYDEDFFGDGFFSTLHECGHAMYNQGLPTEHFGLPIGDDAGLGIHESQSRMWENLVGRSRSFWKFFYPRVQAAFPQVLKDVDEQQFHFAVNDVRPSLIRTESDETTYNLHVMVRFELELALLSGDLAVRDLPAAWNAKMREYLGIEPTTDREGVLQDVHWSEGAIGYFPTYTLGNLYAAQFFEQAKADVPGLEEQFAAGEFSGLLSWLRRNIHAHGRRYYASELIQRITGKPLSAQPLLNHLKRKAEELYL